jgi:hypothetical protein
LVRPAQTVASPTHGVLPAQRFRDPFGPALAKAAQITPPTGAVQTFESFNAALEEAVSHLRMAYHTVATAAQYTGKDKGNIPLQTGPVAITMLGIISQLARYIENGMPAELCEEPPGYKTRAEVKGMPAK